MTTTKLSREDTATQEPAVNTCGSSGFSSVPSQNASMIKLTALEREALDECLTIYMSDAEGLDYANGNPIVSRKAELELDLSSVAKRKFATYVAATLEAMIAPDTNSGWSSPKSRREACLGLASKIDAAVDAANGVEVTVSGVDSLSSPERGCHPRTELVPGRRYRLPDTGSDEPDAGVALIYQRHEEGLYAFSNSDGEGECDYAAEDLAGLVAQPDAPHGEYLPEPPDAKTVSCDGFSSGPIRYDQMPFDEGFKVLSAMASVAIELNDDLKAKLTVTEEAEAKFGIHLAFRFMPGIELYRRLFKLHNGERDFRLAECKGIEELVKKLGISPATVRTWRQRYRHLPEYRAALEANGIPIEERPERVKKCDSCGTRINLPEGQEPDHDENCPEHPMRREAMAEVRDLAIRGETYKRIACGEGKYAMLPEKSRIQKIQELALGTPVSDLVELDDFSVLLNRIRGQEMDEMLSLVKEYYAHQRERLSILGIELVIQENSDTNDITSPAVSGEVENVQDGSAGNTLVPAETVQPTVGAAAEDEQESAKPEAEPMKKPAAASVKTSLIYVPKGRAREYAGLACNDYSGCDHGCTYCFAPSATQRTRDQFCTPRLRSGDFLGKLEKEAASLTPSVPILLSFTTDPYQILDVKEQVTRQVIQILHRYGHNVTILTKGGSRALRDLDLMTPNDAFATTLTCLDEGVSSQWEPGAATPLDRITTIQKFHEAGIPTWVSLEPVISPADAMEIIRQTNSYVDLFKVGKLNYHAHAKTIDWAAFAKEVVALLDSFGCEYLLKKDLRAYIQPEQAA